MKDIPFTKKGYETLKKKLLLLNSKRPEAVKTLTRAREMGDLSENGLYKAARFELSDIDRQIRHLNYLLKYAKIYNPSGNSIIQIGSKVTLEQNGKKRVFTITGEYEANPNDGKISYKSPLGKNLLNKKLNSFVEIITQGKKTTYAIDRISK